MKKPMSDTNKNKKSIQKVKQTKTVLLIIREYVNILGKNPVNIMGSNSGTNYVVASHIFIILKNKKIDGYLNIG